MLVFRQGRIFTTRERRRENPGTSIATIRGTTHPRLIRIQLFFMSVEEEEGAEMGGEGWEGKNKETRTIAIFIIWDPCRTFAFNGPHQWPLLTLLLLRTSENTLLLFLQILLRKSPLISRYPRLMQVRYIQIEIKSNID